MEAGTRSLPQSTIVKHERLTRDPNQRDSQQSADSKQHFIKTSTLSQSPTGLSWPALLTASSGAGEGVAVKETKGR